MRKTIKKASKTNNYKEDHKMDRFDKGEVMIMAMMKKKPKGKKVKK